MPLLFLDVDGPLIPFGASTPYPAYALESPSNPLLARINPAYGAKLLTLPCTLVWATSWLQDANDAVSPRLGLPRLPVVDWPDADPEPTLHWKTAPLVKWAAGRPFAWVDDEITAADRAWVSTHHPAPALLHRVDPRHGLTSADFDLLREWLTGVA